MSPARRHTERTSHRVGSGARVALGGLVGVLVLATATWIGVHDTDDISADLAALSTTTADLSTLRTARIELEAADQEYAAAMAVGGAEGLRSISRALTHFDAGRRAWDQFKEEVPAFDPAAEDARARIDASLDDIRGQGEAAAVLLLTDQGSPELARIDAEREVQSQALRADLDVIEGVQGERLVAEVESLDDQVDTTHQAVLVGGIAATLAMALVSGFAAIRAHRRERDQDRLTAEREQISRRNALDATLQTAFDMAESEEQAISVVRRALQEAIPGHPSELLLADSPSAELSRVASATPDDPGCLVPAPDRCPAARHGQRMVFEDPDALNACFYLQDRPSGPCSAVCAPVNVAGRAVGVVHVTAPVRRPPGDLEIGTIEVIARKTSERLSTLRAFGSISAQARTDPLTGLLNRRSTDAALEALDSAGTAYTVAFADLDHFKVLNDTHGHPVGDKALQLFAHVLRSSVRPGDLVGRWGGEEFVLVFPECDVDAAVAVLDRVQANLAVALAASSLPPFTCSFGVAEQSHGRTYRDVVEAADSGLLRAKARGRNRIEPELAHDPGTS